MPKRTDNSKARKERAIALRKDAFGLTPRDVNKLLRPTADWPFVEDVDDELVTIGFRLHFGLSNGPQKCWLCGRKRWLDACHIVPRSDERANLVAFCSMRPEFGYQDSCHTLTEKNWKLLEDVLFAKWKNDRDHTSYMTIAIRRRKLFLFDIVKQEQQ